MSSVIDKLAWIYIVDRKLLCARSHGKDSYYLPGGKRESGESDEAALIREVLEELNVDLLPNTITYVGTFSAQAHGKPEGVMVRMTCYTADYTGQLSPTNEIEEAAWLTYADRENTSEVSKIILDWLVNQDLID
jgi:8-oxo-dGTP diphosphatase